MSETGKQIQSLKEELERLETAIRRGTDDVVHLSELIDALNQADGGSDMIVRGHLMIIRAYTLAGHSMPDNIQDALSISSAFLKEKRASWHASLNQAVYEKSERMHSQSVKMRLRDEMLSRLNELYRSDK